MGEILDKIRNNNIGTDQWNGYKQKLTKTYTKKIASLLNVYNKRLKCKALKEGYSKLQHERSILMSCVSDYNPKDDKGNICWQSDMNEIYAIRDECDFYDKDRVEYFKLK